MEQESVRNKIGVLTVSDTRGFENDESGPAIIEELLRLGFEDVERRVCKDEPAAIKTNLIELCDICAAVFTTGGTGFSHRDRTPEATLHVIERQANSISELVRLRGLEHTPYSHLSRGVSGIRGNTLIVNLPGSPKGASQGVIALADILGPILAALSDESCPVDAR
jgi:molybdopterin adenylyltransferase